MTFLLEAAVPPKRRTQFVTAGLTVPARDALVSASLQLSAAADRRISMSAVLLAALDVAAAHRDEWVRALVESPGESEGDNDDD